jgi:hypothetical protein
LLKRNSAIGRIHDNGTDRFRPNGKGKNAKAERQRPRLQPVHPTAADIQFATPARLHQRRSFISRIEAENNPGAPREGDEKACAVFRTPL